MSKVLCDTDFLISSVLSTESTHSRACELYESIVDCQLCVTTLVKYELANVLSRKMEHHKACQILKDLLEQPLNVISAEDHEEEAFNLYYEQTKKNISFTDCTNVVIAKKYGWKIASFDAFYPKSLLVRY